MDETMVPPKERRLSWGIIQRPWVLAGSKWRAMYRVVMLPRGPVEGSRRACIWVRSNLEVNADRRRPPNFSVGIRGSKKVTTQQSRMSLGTRISLNLQDANKR